LRRKRIGAKALSGRTSLRGNSPSHHSSRLAGVLGVARRCASVRSMADLRVPWDLRERVCCGSLRSCDPQTHQANSPRARTDWCGFLIVLYGPFWFIGAGLIDVYPGQMSYGPIDGPYLLTAGYGGPPVVDAFTIVPFMTASMLSRISVVMTLGFASAALRAGRPTLPT